ncbi:cytochrome P450 [Alteribacter lacisalsi]|uniref:Cytochrome P450 n=1 Tax=Alteribacter lacisalsi TaxID=2045244 RepID=A0A2W0HV89_9BACI|nr:cytochrome P450 [Alteribacter lacisalsi]PYZ97588.1 cytochrome P450 [Alteribacter lacisalsi]
MTNKQELPPHRPPGPAGTWFKGSLDAFKKDPLAFLRIQAETFGPLASFRLGPFQRFHLVNDPHLISTVFADKEKRLVKSRDIQTLKSIVGEGLLTSEKAFHLKQRRMIQPAFRHTHIAKYGEEMTAVTKQIIRNWEGKSELNIADEMMDITLAIIAKTMFSMDFEEGSRKIGKPMESIMKLGIRRMRNPFSLPLWIPVRDNRRLKGAVQELDRVIYRIIEKRKQSGDNYEDLLGILMQASEGGKGLTDRQLRDELMTIFLAGHETTANLLTWTLYLLGQHPEEQKKIHMELDNVTGKGGVKAAHFMNFSCVKNAVWESMRLYPPAYVVGRQAETDLELGGYRIKKGETLLLSQYVMHRNASFFTEPDLFKPDRFKDDFMKSLPSGTYFPFGGGARICIGNHFSLMEAVLVLAVILKQYRVAISDNCPAVKPQPLITLRPKYGLIMEIHKR